MRKFIALITVNIILIFSLFSCNHSYLKESFNETNTHDYSVITEEISKPVSEYTEYADLQSEPTVYVPKVFSVADALKLCTDSEYYKQILSNQNLSPLGREDYIYSKMFSSIVQGIGGIPISKCYEDHPTLAIQLFPGAINSENPMHSVRS